MWPLRRCSLSIATRGFRPAGGLDDRAVYKDDLDPCMWEETVMTIQVGTDDPTTGVTRRTMLKRAATGVALLGAPLVWRKASAQAKRIVIRDPGGPFAPAYMEAFYKPFREAT